MRLGGPIYAKCDNPREWAIAVRNAGYRAAYSPVDIGASDDLVKAYAAEAEKAGIVISEVGTWSNTLSTDKATREAALDRCKKGLALADLIGARCCVNIAGSLGAKWDGPCPKDLSKRTFDMIVVMVRDIIDAVKPVRSFYTLETMPWMYPDSVDACERLIKAIDRKAFAVHFDPANLVCSPQIYFRNGDMIKDFVAKLGPHIKSCHAKDILLGQTMTVHLDEVRPGTGGLDYPVLLKELAKLDPDTPLMLEHLPDEEEYTKAANHIRKIAGAQGVPL